jgi:hypothetical protein
VFDIDLLRRLHWENSNQAAALGRGLSFRMKFCKCSW